MPADPVAAAAAHLDAEDGQQKAADDEQRKTEDVVVSGRRQAIADAQDKQLKSESFATIVSGEELRAQPQQNLADLLTRLPGLSSAVDQSRNAAGTGEAQYLSIRGLDNAYNAYMFDGVRLAQTDARTRAISMNLLSPFALAEVRVDKAPTAALDGDAIAGVIDMRTASAFTLPDNYVQLRAQGQVAGRAAARDQDPWGGIAQIETAQRFGNFGVYASAYYGRKNILGESVAMQHEWEKYNNAIPGMIRDNLDNLAPRGVQWNVFRNRIERIGGTLNLDWKSEEIDVYSRTTYGRYKLKSYMDQTALRQTDLAPGQVNPNPGGRSYDVAGFRADYGLTATAYHRTEHSDQDLFSTKLGGQSRVGALTFDFHAAYSRGEQDYPLRIQSGFSTRPYIGAADPGVATERLVTSIGDRTMPRVVMSSGAQAALTDLTKIKQWYVTAQFENAWESRVEGQFDANWKLADEGVSSLSAGAKVEGSKRYSNSLGTDGALLYTFPLPSGANSPRYAATGPSIADTPGTVMSSFMHGGAQVPIKLLDTGHIEDQVRRLSLVKLPGVDPNLFRENRLDGKEQRIGAYMLANLKFGYLSIIPGIRYEYNRFKGTYFQDQGTAKAFVTSARNYDQWLPSVIASFRPDDRTVFRASARKSYSRPAFDLLLGPTRIGRNDAGQIDSVFIPNPNLDAVESWNFDASAEYKGDGSDFFSLGVYYKRLNHVLFATGTTNAGGDYNVWSDTAPTAVDGVEVSTLDTSAKGKVYGVEATARYSFKGLPGIFDGIGIGGNLTAQRANARVLVNGQMRSQRLTQAPRLMYNAELFYLRGGVSAALNYNYTGDRLYDLRSDRPDTYIQPVAKMNAMLAYTFDSGLILGASVENVLDAHNYWATTSQRKAYLSNDRKGGYVETGRVYMMNVAYKF